MKKTYLSFNQLQMFIAIAETGSFTLAANRLSLTQPGISHGVRELEATLGVRLFERQRGEGATLTSAGSRALTEARAALIHLERLRYAAHSEATLLSGRLRLDCFPSAANTRLPALLAKYHRHYPKVQLDIREDAGETVTTAIYSREVDLGMMVLPDTQQFATFPAYQDELLIVINQKNSFQIPEGRVSPKSLKDKPFLMPDDATKELVFSAFATAGVQPNTVLTVQNTSMLLELVREGLGITVLPSNSLEPSRLTGLQTRKLKPRVSRQVVFAARSLEALSPAANAFIQLLANYKSL
jgi:DNA-binding transcriptional LysR family regulator